MILRLYKSLIGLIKIVTKSIRTRIIFLVHVIDVTESEQGPVAKFFVASLMRYARIKGPRSRLVSGHAPIFSLFTYFPNRH